MAKKDTRTLHEIVFSVDYLKHNGITVVRLQESSKSGDKLTKDNMQPRKIAEGPLCEFSPNVMGISWSPSLFQSRVTVSDYIKKSKFGGAASMASEALLGTTNAESFSKSVLNIDGFSSPEFSFTFLLDYYRQKDSYIEYLTNLQQLFSSPGTSALAMKSPYDFAPPMKLIPDIIAGSKGIKDGLPLDDYCAIYIGDRYFIKGLANTNITFQPSPALANRNTPYYYKITMQMVGGRTPIFEEYKEQYSHKYEPNAGAHSL